MRSLKKRVHGKYRIFFCALSLVSFEFASVDLNYDTYTIHSQSFSCTAISLLAVDSF